jgi:FkbM family methyltransferase
MSIQTLLKRPVKAVFKQFPTLDVLSRRFVWKHVYPKLYLHEAELHFLNALPRNAIDVAVDVGAAMGSFAWILNKVSRKVYGFEPGRVHSRCLQRASFGTNIEVVRAAVGNEAGTVRLFTPGKDPNARYQASISLENPVTQADDALVDEVPQVRLDDWFKGKLAADRRIDFVKVDVEGYENNVFRGARGLIDKYKPLVIAEIEIRHNPNYRESFDFFRELGYRRFIMRDGRFEEHLDDDIAPIQTAADLHHRLTEGPSLDNRYINNFTFEHADSRVKVST